LTIINSHYPAALSPPGTILDRDPGWFWEGSGWRVANSICVLTYFFKSYHHFFKSAVLWVLDITIFANHLITSLAEGNPFYLTRNQKVANKPLAARQ